MHFLLKAIFDALPARDLVVRWNECYGVQDVNDFVKDDNWKQPY